MIKNVNSSGRYLVVSSSGGTGPYISPGSAGAGMMRWNPNMNQIEVNDGNTWLPMTPGYATVELTPDTESLLEWARLERTKQRIREERVQSNPALRKAYEAIVRAEENFDLLDSIAGEFTLKEKESI